MAQTATTSQRCVTIDSTVSIRLAFCCQRIANANASGDILRRGSDEHKKVMREAVAGADFGGRNSAASLYSCRQQHCRRDDCDKTSVLHLSFS